MKIVHSLHPTRLHFLRLLTWLLPAALLWRLHRPFNVMGTMPHIMVVLELNSSYSEAIGSSNWPQLKALMQVNGLADNDFAVAHPNLPNCLALLSGSTQGVRNCSR